MRLIADLSDDLELYTIHLEVQISHYTEGLLPLGSKGLSHGRHGKRRPTFQLFSLNPSETSIAAIPVPTYGC